MPTPATIEIAVMKRRIRYRIRVSQAAIRAAVAGARRGKSDRIIDYHEGCIGMGLCLIADLDRTPTHKKGQK